MPQFLPSVTELVVAQCYYLDFDDKNRNKPIYVYLNSTGCINEQGQAVSADNEFYAIWAALGFTRAPLYTGEVYHGSCCSCLVELGAMTAARGVPWLLLLSGA